MLFFCVYKCLRKVRNNKKRTIIFKDGAYFIITDWNYFVNKTFPLLILILNPLNKGL